MIDDILPALPAPRGSRGVVALIKRLEAGERESWTQVMRAHAPDMLARLQQAVAGVGAVDAAFGSLAPKLAMERRPRLARAICVAESRQASARVRLPDRPRGSRVTAARRRPGVLFLDDQTTLGDDGDLAQLASRVFHFTDELKPAPAGNEAVRFTRDRPLPPPAIVEALGLVLSEAYEETYEKFADAAPQPHAMLHARATYFRGLPAPGETLLLQLRRDPVGVFFVIADEALAARDFSAARCVADEG